ncbi:killer cell lectin-like receptor subfamily B member 1C isoform X2 [Ictalurus furcatus]|uniref:killer cell lectin-like receptor subfamily B member 1C isoform X2 n=1 Tax=Ictalurus furcatus TaxID=66913 RepID=UPI00234FC673|nr:killer cell lectin-like receptor subfamily B member 1C isoform X2 [Ictalurus furcatus]
MDGEKMAEVEMKEIIPAEVPDNKDAEKGNMEGTKEADKKAEEKEKKEEETNVYCKLNNPTEDIYNASTSTSTPKRNEADKKEKEKKEEETNVYCKLNNPTEDIYNASTSTFTPKCNEEAEKKAEKKEKKEEGNVYCKLKNPTEDIYNASTGTSTPKRSEAKKVKEKEKDEEGEETSVYCKLKDPSENVYMAAMSSSTPKHNDDVCRKVHLYKRICAGFIILSSLLLAVIFALAVKLNEVQSSQKCADLSAEVQTMPNYPLNQGYRCPACEKGWLKFENSCYFIARTRLTWQQSREDCQTRGGDLAVIDNEGLQKRLTEIRSVLYWIGLHYSEKQQWMWINNTAPTQSYWAHGQPRLNSQGSCALLKAERSQTNNWISNRCGVLSQYICQRD